MSKKFLYFDSAVNGYTEADSFQSTDFIASTAGVADAGKPIKTDANGLLDSSFISEYVASVVSGVEWQDSVLDKDTLTPPGSPATGARYLINGVGTGAWASKDNQIAEWNGSAWVFTVPTTGMFVAADDETSVVYYYGGASWSAKEWENTTASTGLTKVGSDIRLDSSSAGDGLGFLAGVLSVKVASAGGLEISSDEVQVKADGIKDTMIDFGTGAGQVSGADIPLADAGGYFATDDVESALQYLGSQLGAFGVSYTVGVGGVTKGDVVYISANNTVLRYSTLTADEYSIGLALTTEVASASVKVLANDTVLTGVLSGATAGDVYYWNGSALSTIVPTGTGGWVIQAGIAKNATDLHVEVMKVKKNS